MVISCYSYFISIHSLARRLTLRLDLMKVLDTHFNSQPRKEADILTLTCSDFELHFNSQPRKEAD